MARMTWDGSSEPEVQAEPLDAAMPSLLSFRRIAFALDVLEGDVGRVGQAIVGIAGDEGIRNHGENPLFEPVAHGLDAGVLEGQVFQRQLGGLAQADDRGRVLGARPPAALLMAAADNGRKRVPRRR